MRKYTIIFCLLLLTNGCDISKPGNLASTSDKANAGSLSQLEGDSSVEQTVSSGASTAKSKQEIAADKETLKELMRRLEVGDPDEVYDIERKLDSFGQTAIPFVINGLKSPHPHVREACSTSLYFFAQDKSAKHYVSKTAEPLLVAASTEQDTNVLSIMAQTISMMKPDHQLALPALLKMLEIGSSNSKQNVVDAIENYGPNAAMARKSLHNAYLNADDDAEPESKPRLRTSIHFAFIKIGSTEEDANLIASTELMTEREKATAVKVLLNHPAHAMDYLRPVSYTHLTLPTKA